MRIKSTFIALVLIGLIMQPTTTAYSSDDTATINEEISNLQSQIMRDTELASIERMHIANIERNIAMAQESNQRWAEKLATETDPQLRSYYQQTIDGWNRWIANDMSNELNQRNQSLNTSLTNILENQQKVTSAENRLLSQVQSSISDPNVSVDQQVKNIEALNSALENRANVDLFTTQRQIFTINALNAQMGMLSPNSDLYKSLFGARQNLQVVLDKTAEAYVLKNQILTAQKAAVENLKALQVVTTANQISEDKVVVDVRDTTLKLNTEIKENASQITNIQASIKELTERLNSFSVGDPTYNQTLASIDLLKKTLTELEGSKEDLALISKANQDLVESVKAETVVDRFVEQISEQTGDAENNLAAALVEVKKNKRGKFLANFKIGKDDADPFALESEEIKELSLTLKNNKREYKLRLAAVNENVAQWSFTKRPVKGNYRLLVSHTQSEDEVAISARVVIK